MNEEKSLVVFEIKPDFNWDSEDGQLMNIILNMSGGLEYKYLSEQEKELLKKNGYKAEE